jgi:predicted outer membrane repeat protein
MVSVTGRFLLLCLTIGICAGGCGGSSSSGNDGGAGRGGAGAGGRGGGGAGHGGSAAGTGGGGASGTVGTGGSVGGATADGGSAGAAGADAGGAGGGAGAAGSGAAGAGSGGAGAGGHGGGGGTAGIGGTSGAAGSAGAAGHGGTGGGSGSAGTGGGSGSGGATGTGGAAGVAGAGGTAGAAGTGGAAGVGGATGVGGGAAGNGGGAGIAGNAAGAGGAAGTGGSSAAGAGGGNSGTTGSAGVSGSGGAGGSVCPEGFTGSNCSVCVVYVNQAAGANTNDGVTWATAKLGIQAGIDTAFAHAPACVVWVARGTYVPTYKPDAFGADNTATLLLRAGVGVYGGFAGGERSLAARDIPTNQTIVTGEIGSTAQTDNLTAVVTSSASGATLDGFTVTAGYAPTTYGGGLTCSAGSVTVANCNFTSNAAKAGGAVYIHNGCSMTIADSGFSSNGTIGTSQPWGGAIYVDNGGAAVIQRSSFSSNHASVIGGAICSDGTLQISDSSFASNWTNSEGGAIYAYGVMKVDRSTFTGNAVYDPAATGGAISTSASPSTITNSRFDSNVVYGTQVSGVPGGGAIRAHVALDIDQTTFVGNNAAGQEYGWGGAIYSEYPLRIKNSSFTSNRAAASGSNSGGAIECMGCTLTVVSTTFDGNSTAGSSLDTTATGGAVDVESPGTASFANCRFASNTTNGMGGAISYLSSGATDAIRDCTFFGNTALGQGGAVYKSDNKTTTFTNTILWGNQAGTGGNHVYLQGVNSKTLVRSCDVGGSGFDGADGNIDADPMFVSEAGTIDLHLKTGSPCIDKGGSADVAADALDLDGDGNLTEPLPFDLDGQARVQGASVDIGAYDRAP